jgi:hypothetical protein
VKTKYDTINNKLKKLKRNKINNYTNNNTTQHTLFNRSVNMTDIIFTEIDIEAQKIEEPINIKPK